MVEIAVDPDTGDIEVLDWVTVDDVGRCLYPNGVIHQIEGAMIMQLGYTRAWEQIFDPTTGATINGTFIDQKNPTPLDVPLTVMKGSYYESNNNSSPYGIMGVGEPPTIPYVAFHNAFYNATGKRIKESCINPARALAALGKI
jgi:carbon-monoxide dehydrogenase large subunit